MAAPPCLLLLIAILCAVAVAEGWAFADVHDLCPDILTPNSLRNAPPDSATLRLAVPWKVAFGQFVRFWPANCSISGFSVEVFRSALPHLQDPRLRRLRFVLIGNGSRTPSYNDMVEMVRNKTVDGVVADLTINRDRSERVGFTVPYLASYLVMVTPLRYPDHGSLWDFLRPFSTLLWLTLLGCFVFTGLLLYYLEDQNPDFSIPAKTKNDGSQGSQHGESLRDALMNNPSVIEPLKAFENPPLRVRSIRDNHNNLVVQDISSLQRPGPPIYDQASKKSRIMNAYWFTSLCVFMAQQESVRTHPGRVATVMWLFALAVFNSCYTASLTSILSSQQSYPAIAGFQVLLGDTSIPVGYQEGSFMDSYMKNLNLMNHVTKPFNSVDQISKALQKGSPDGIGAMLLEGPYSQSLLQSHCDLTKSSRNDDNLPSFGGFGFAFRHGDALIDELSKIILQMGENGTLKDLRETWKVGDAAGSQCDAGASSSSLGPTSFAGLFIIGGALYGICVALCFFTKAIKSPKQANDLMCTLSCCGTEYSMAPQTEDMLIPIRVHDDDIQENQ